ncbi:hypothetical protein D3C73_508550 [compost metagenome]
MRVKRHRLRADINLDARNGAGCGHDVDERSAVGCLLVEGFFIEDDTGNAVLHRCFGAEEHLAVVTAALFGRLDPDAIEALFDRPGGLVGGQKALAVRYHLECNIFQTFGHLSISNT